MIAYYQLSVRQGTWQDRWWKVLGRFPCLDDAKSFANRDNIHGKVLGWHEELFANGGADKTFTSINGEQYQIDAIDSY